jgi:hypothetical protein
MQENKGEIMKIIEIEGDHDFIVIVPTINI